VNIIHQVFKLLDRTVFPLPFKQESFLKRVT